MQSSQAALARTLPSEPASFDTPRAGPHLAILDSCVWQLACGTVKRPVSRGCFDCASGLCLTPQIDPQHPALEWPLQTVSALSRLLHDI